MEPKKQKATRAVMLWNVQQKALRNGNTDGTEVESLLPGILNDVVLTEIVPKLPRKSVCSLAAASTAWLHAIQNRDIHDARVRSGTVEWLVLLRYAPAIIEFYEVLALYSIEDGHYFELPPLPLPYNERGIPTDCECVTLDGKVYVLGGKELGFLHVFVLDLASQPRKWRQCASMLGPKKEFFKCAALNRKVYVGGVDFDGVYVSEVYDPQANTWSLMKPMPHRQSKLFHYLSLWSLDMFAAVGEELYAISPQPDFSATRLSFTVEVYHPDKNEWRVEKYHSRIRGNANNDADESSVILFKAHGKLFRMIGRCISVLDTNTKKWYLQHKCWFTHVEASDIHVDLVKLVKAVTLVGDELLAILRSDEDSDNMILQCEGFGCENLDVQWKETELAPTNLDEFLCWVPREVYPIEL